MPNRITVNWQDRYVMYWWPDHVIMHPSLSWESLYDVLLMGMVNGYKRHDFKNVASILERGE